MIRITQLLSLNLRVWAGKLAGALEAKYEVLIEVQHQLMFTQAPAAVHALQEGVIMDVRKADVGVILG